MLWTSLSRVCAFHWNTLSQRCVCVSMPPMTCVPAFVCARGHFNDLRNNSSVPVNAGATMCGFFCTFAYYTLKIQSVNVCLCSQALIYDKKCHANTF